MRARVGFHIRLALGLAAAGMLLGAGLFGGRIGLTPLRAGLLVIGAGAFYLLARSLDRQTARLVEAARHWGRGEFTHRAALGAGQGLTEVGQALDAMAAALQQHEETARRRAEEQIIQAEKLATVGRLAAGVAHEINNPLGGILLYSDLLLESLPKDDAQRESVTRIIGQATRAREIVRGLLDFAHPSAPVVERIDLNGVVTGVLTLLERQPLYQRVRVQRELSATPLWVLADGSKLQQVFTNIIMNALEAMREGGTLTVRSGLSERAGFCRVAVSDTGFGISEEDRSRIFEPFFTTKEVGQGIGLGLAISYGIMQQHGGEIEVQSAVGSGTTVRILIPAAGEA